MNKKQVTLFGSSGLIGGFLLNELLADASLEKIVVVSRRALVLSHPKLEVRRINFSSQKEVEGVVENSSVVFSCIGTTQARVKGDKDAYRKVDYDITLSIAKGCKTKNVSSFLYVSSAGAKPSSAGFYLKLKGEIDDAVTALNLPSTTILRPSLLLGKRNEFRFGEKIAQLVMPLFAFLLPKKLRPISGEKVAKAMIDCAQKRQEGTRILENNDLL